MGGQSISVMMFEMWIWREGTRRSWNSTLVLQIRRKMLCKNVKITSKRIFSTSQNVVKFSNIWSNKSNFFRFPDWISSMTVSYPVGANLTIHQTEKSQSDRPQDVLFNTLSKTSLHGQQYILENQTLRVVCV